MRTTINLPDGLGAEAKALAQGRTFTSLVEEGLRLVLADGHSRSRSTSTEPLPSFGDAGAQLLVDPADREAVWRALDAEGPR